MARHIAIVGMGPTGIYCLQKLIEHPQSLTISVFEAGAQAGVGMPYSTDSCRKSMLANIASIEIPNLPQSYLNWMNALPNAVLRGYGIEPEGLDDRTFTPRLLLGQYFRSQFVELLHIAEARDHVVHLYEETEIVDVMPGADGVRIADSVAIRDEVFDRVVLSTGHVWPDEVENTDTYYPSPWTGLFEADIPAVRVGVMGTSLSSIDAAMAVAVQHGSFERRENCDLVYTLAENSDELAITLMSRSGILPEADFYCPIPHEPLCKMTDDALRTAVAAGQDGLLDRVFDLFKDEIFAGDPDWADANEISATTADDFTEVYFRDRLKRDPFLWAASNLIEVERNKAEKRTVAWRYAILRMHEKIEALITNLTTMTATGSRMG